MSIKNMKINKDWLYHRFNSVKLKKIIISGGLKARKNLDKQSKKEAINGTWNGNHFISLAKRMEGEDTSFRHYIEGEFAFIIDPDLDAIKAEVRDLDSFYEAIAKLPIKKRFAGREGEYQVKGNIPFDKIVGIKIPSGDRFFHTIYPEDHTKEELEKILSVLDEYDCKLPFIDVEKGKVVSKDEIREYLDNKMREEKINDKRK